MVTELLSSIDASATVLDFIRFKNDNKYVDKAMATLPNKAIRDIIVAKSKSILKGKNIYINNLY